MSSTYSSIPGYGYPPDNQPIQTLNTRIMVAAIIVLFLVVLFILSLHVYAKWFWRYSSALGRNPTHSWRRRRFDFAGQDPFIVAGSVGLDKAVINSLPAFVYQAPSADDQTVLECAVCLCDFQDKENGRLLPKCNHSFHTECIDMWFYSHSTCPLCRTLVTPESSPAASHEQTPSAQASASSSPLFQESRTLDQLRIGMETSLAASSTASVLPTEDNILSTPRSDDNQESSRLSSQSTGTSHTRSVPQIAIDIQRTADSSLSLPSCPSTDEQSCSSPGGQPLKSPSTLRNSIKRLLSRERRVFPSDREGVELEQEPLVSPV